MNDDIEFTVGLDISPTEQKLSEIQSRFNKAQAMLSAQKIPSIDKRLKRSDTSLTNIEKLFASIQGTSGQLTSKQISSIANRLKTIQRNIKSSTKDLNPLTTYLDPEKQQQEGITEELKRQDKEITNNTQGFLKTLAVLFSIKKIIDAIVGAWKGFGKITGDVYGHITQQRGNFTSDPTGTLRVHTDLLYPRLIEGAIAYQRAGGKLITKENLDTMNSKMANAFAQAMAGEGVSTRGSIAAQRLHDVIGSQLTAEMLLTGQTGGLSNTELSVDLINKFEDFMTSGKWTKLSKPEQGQLLSSIKELLGEDVVNAIVQNVLNNQAIKDPSARKSLTERLLGAGGAAVEFGNLTENVTKSVTALALLNSATETLKNTIVDNFTPAFVSATSVITAGIKRISAWLDKDRGAILDANGMPVISQTLASLRDENIFKTYYANRKGFFGIDKGFEADKEDIDRKNIKNIVTELYTHAVNKNNATSLLDSILLNTKGVDIYGGANFEAISQRRILAGFADMLYYGNNQQYRETGNSLWEELADINRETVLKELQGDRAFQMSKHPELAEMLIKGTSNLTRAQIEQAMESIAASSWWKTRMYSYYSEGKLFDFTKGASPFAYLFGDSRFFLNSTEQLNAIDEFLDEVANASEKIASMKISKWEDTDRNQRVSFDELKVKVQLVGEGTSREMTFNEALNANTR